MLYIYDLTIDAPNEKSATWYKNFHDAFCMCQLVNNGIFSLLDLFEADTGVGADILIREIMLGMNSRVNDINNIHEFLGEDISDFNKNVQLDIERIIGLTVSGSWSESLKGFLNIWEFIFIFCLFEGAARNLVSRKTLMRKVVPSIFEKYPDQVRMLDLEFCFTEDLYFRAWNVFVSLRNIYSHSHGVMDAKSRSDLVKRITEFRSAYENSFNESQSENSLILEAMSPGSDDLFDEDKIQNGKFYFIEDKELNIFKSLFTKLLWAVSQN